MLCVSGGTVLRSFTEVTGEELSFGGRFRSEFLVWCGGGWGIGDGKLGYGCFGCGGGTFRGCHWFGWFFAGGLGVKICLCLGEFGVYFEWKREVSLSGASCFVFGLCLLGVFLVGVILFLVMYSWGSLKWGSLK